MKVLHFVAAMLISISLINFRRAYGSPIQNPTKTPSEVEGPQHNSAEPENPEEDLSALLSDHHEDGGYDEEEEEVECPPGQWYHIRGQRCVPQVCVGGNRFRDITTGRLHLYLLI